MPDWSASMQQTFEYYTVDPGTWKDDKKINTVISSTIDRDSELETLGSASLNVTDLIGECYVRIYLITIQNGITEKFPLATVLVQTPSLDYNGKTRKVTMDGYTSLLELKEKLPPLGYSILKKENIMDIACRLSQENTRAPVALITNSTKLEHDFVADPSDTWLSFLTALIGNAKYTYMVDELGRILFSPIQDTASLQPVWTFDDSNSSILYSDFNMEHDIFDVPNVVEVVYSNGTNSWYAKAVNKDPNSPTSTVSRGREIPYRDTNPSLVGNTTQAEVNEYAERILKEASTLEYTIQYSHGYCPVRVGDCVRINHSRFGLNGIKAKVVSQKIDCRPGCKVTEKAVFTTNLWR